MAFDSSPQTPLAACWLTAGTADVIELIRACAATGYSAVGVKALDPGTPDTPEIGAGGQSPAVVRRIASEEGIAIYRTTGFWLDGRYSRDRYYPFLAASAELGATYAGSIALDTDTQRMTDDFGDLCRLAAEFDLQVTIEFAAFTTVRTIQDARALIERSGQGNASILVDALHLFRSGGTAQDVREVPASLIKVVQICDARATAPAASELFREALEDRLDPGEGALPLEAFMDALPPSPILEVEAPCLARRALTPAERLRGAGDATRAFLERASGGKVHRHPLASGAVPGLP